MIGHNLHVIKDNKCCSLICFSRVETGKKGTIVENDARNDTTENGPTTESPAVVEIMQITGTTRNDGIELSTPEIQNTDTVELNQEKSNHKHKVGVKKNWKDKFPWAVISTRTEDGVEKDVVVCSLCKRHKCNGKNGKKTWTEDGYRLLREDKLKEHQNSDQHKEALGIEVNQKITHMSETVTSESRESVTDAFRVLYFLISNNLPLDLFKKAIDLCVATGSPTLKKYRERKNATYSSWDIIHELLGLLNEEVKESVLDELNNSPTFSTMVDEVSDNRSIKHMAVCTRYISPEGEIKSAFLTDCELPVATANVVTETLVNALSDNELSVKDMSSFASDGAAVFTGKKSGVGKQLKDRNPELISYHCRDHRLALACRDTFLKVPGMKKVDGVLENLYKYYKYSCPHTASLKKIQTVLDEAPLQIKQAKHHRWLSHEQAVISVVRCYQSIVTDLESNTISNDPVGNGILKSMKDPLVLKTILFLADVLPHVTNLSRFFQRRDVHIGLVKPMVEKTTNAIENRRSQPGPWQQKESQICSDIGIEPDTSCKFDTDIKEPYITTLLENIESRFSDKDIIDNMGILDLSSDEDIMSLHGFAEMESIARHFNIDTEDLITEWEDFCQFMNTRKRSERSISKMVELFYSKSQQDKGLLQLYPRIAKLLAVAMCLPLSTAEVERVFSQVKLIKTSHRSSMHTATLTKLLNIKLNCREQDFESYLEKMSMKFVRKERRI